MLLGIAAGFVLSSVPPVSTKQRRGMSGPLAYLAGLTLALCCVAIVIRFSNVVLMPPT